jgi:3-methyl-2-oxobutanoate hydroxymethyltransferase
MVEAVKTYSEEVKAGTFPAQEHCYSINEEIIEKLY